MHGYGPFNRNALWLKAQASCHYDVPIPLNGENKAPLAVLRTPIPDKRAVRIDIVDGQKIDPTNRPKLGPKKENPKSDSRSAVVFKRSESRKLEALIRGDQK
jgi:hypothetical protein